MNTRRNLPSIAALIMVLGVAGLPAVAQAHDDGYRDDDRRHSAYERRHDHRRHVRARHIRWSVNRGAFGWGHHPGYRGYRPGFRSGHHSRHHRRVYAPRYGYRTSVQIWVGGSRFSYRDRCD